MLLKSLIYVLMQNFLDDATTQNHFFASSTFVAKINYKSEQFSINQ